MAFDNPAFAALEALDASLAYARTAQLAKTQEQILREHADGQDAMARRFLQLAKEHRAWRVALATWNPGALRFYRDEVPALMTAVARHRRSAQVSRARIAAMSALHRKAAA